VALLRWLSGWLLSRDDPDAVAGLWPGLAAAVNVVVLILEVAAGPLIGLALLLAPVIVIEECSTGRALREWWRFVRQHFRRAFLYETLAATLAAVTTLPLLFPVAVAALRQVGQPEPLGTVTRAALCVLGGVALTPFIAFLAVANVFIYLNLRYQHSARK